MRSLISTTRTSASGVGRLSCRSLNVFPSTFVGLVVYAILVNLPVGLRPHRTERLTCAAIMPLLLKLQYMEFAGQRPWLRSVVPLLESDDCAGNWPRGPTSIVGAADCRDRRGRVAAPDHRRRIGRRRFAAPPGSA